MRTFEELYKESSATNDHHCSSQALGIRMAMAGCREVGIDEPKGCKHLMISMEIDCCATDAVQAVTGCSLGKRTLKFLDYGKMAATFVNLETRKAVRVVARSDSGAVAPLDDHDTAILRGAKEQAYANMPEATLFTIQFNAIAARQEELPGFRDGNVTCAGCGEGVSYRREVLSGGRTLCIACARESYSPGMAAPATDKPAAKVLLIVGYKKVGKTTLIERLIRELFGRGYRVGTVKHHHAGSPLETDSPGTDSWRHRRAGASSVALVSPTEITLFQDFEKTLSLNNIIAKLGGADIVLVEGFHEQPRMKIEVLPGADAKRLCDADPHLIALVGQNLDNEPVPSFTPGELRSLVAFIESEVLEKSTLRAATPKLNTETPLAGWPLSNQNR
jgi:formylmethanofuran dehydrogenase subunit E